MVAPTDVLVVDFVVVELAPEVPRPDRTVVVVTPLLVGCRCRRRTWSTLSTDYSSSCGRRRCVRVFLAGLAEGVDVPQAAETSATATTNKPTCDRRLMHGSSLTTCWNWVTTVTRRQRHAPNVAQMVVNLGQSTICDEIMAFCRSTGIYRALGATFSLHLQGVSQPRTV